MLQRLIPVSLIFLAMLAGYFAPTILAQFLPDDQEVDLAEYCMLSTEPCKTDGATIVLEHDSTKPLEPTRIFVVWPESTAQSLTLEMEGLEMDMGVVKFRLENQGNGNYEGELMLPVCTLDAMTWLGKLSNGDENVKTAVRMTHE
ncbi:hypothetical protein INR79_26385 [Vibrio sp. SCSIO 43132]|uniref:hypothetical protein n=1 Tax=Vibrio sp. SCSIO 43132 TaxID=2779363 RepID=UPI001CA7E374|nr:hypothetical protein [Vibrio sp. SCSIO 43132]UAB72780.1 hypothetical protein INR79_26385 [Vibrio sp. SCSIO 43132]